MTLFESSVLLLICLVAGLILLIWEAFMPGFGVAGITGIVAELLAIACAYVQHGVTFALLLTLIILCVIGLTVYFSYRSAMRGRISKSPLVLQETAKADARVAKAKLGAYMNQKGCAVTPLRPAGTIEIDGKQLAAASTGEFIPKGSMVQVTAIAGDHAVVRKLSE